MICLDCAFNNAGVGRGGSTVDCTEEDWEFTIKVNLTGVWLCMKYEITQMLKQSSGSIVNTASAYGLAAAGGTPSYVASKHGVVGLTKASAMEYAAEGHPSQCGMSGSYQHTNARAGNE